MVKSFLVDWIQFLANMWWLIAMHNSSTNESDNLSPQALDMHVLNTHTDRQTFVHIK